MYVYRIGVLESIYGLKKSFFLRKTRFKVDFTSKYRKIVTNMFNTKGIPIILGAKNGLKKSIFRWETRENVDFSSEYRKIVPITQDIGAKTGLKIQFLQ